MAKRKRIIAEIVIDERTTITVDGNKMSAEFGALDRGSLTDVVDWGIYANRGSISFIDKEGYFNTTNVNQFRLKGAKVVFYLANDEKTKIATFTADDVSYDEETKKVDISLVSSILKLQEEKTTKNIYYFGESSTSFLIASLNDILGKSKITIGEGDFANIVIGCAYIPIDTVWNIMTKMCQATMSRVVENPSGDFEIKSAFPQRTPIILRPKNIVGLSKAEFVILKNPETTATKRKKYINEILDGSKSSFYINWDTEDGKTEIVDSNGITLSDVRTEEEGNDVDIYAKGRVTIKTPYKLFGLQDDYSTYNIKYSYYPKNTEEGLEGFPTGEKTISSKESLLSSAYIDDEQNIVADFDERLIFQKFDVYGNSSVKVYKQFLLSDGTFSIPVTTFEDIGTLSTSYTKGEGDKIESNDLIQDISYYRNSVGDSVELAFHIVTDLYRRYGKGIECFEIDCLFNDYYDVDGKKAFDKDDLSKHFEKYDIIIPYVVRNGVTEPLRVDENGDPKKFRIIGISYTDDGLLKQKLYVQEERYDID